MISGKVHPQSLSYPKRMLSTSSIGCFHFTLSSSFLKDMIYFWPQNLTDMFATRDLTMQI